MFRKRRGDRDYARNFVRGRVVVGAGVVVAKNKQSRKIS
jgi:hypothetical protein